MINARMEILNTEVLDICKSKCIEVYALQKSKANCIAFSTNNRKRREFEITFLKDSKYRISTRFLGYKKVMVERSTNFFADDDPDGRRKRFNVSLNNEEAVNDMVLRMMEQGFSENPDVQRC